VESQFSERKLVIGVIFVFFALIYIVRLFYLQVIEESYRISADDNSKRVVTQYPARGLILDRNRKLMVFNEAAFDLMIIPRQLQPFDTTALSELLGLSLKSIRERIFKAKKYNRYKPSIFTKQLSAKDYAQLQEKMYKFPGFFVQTRTLRKYTKPMAAHVLGYVGEVNDRMVKNEPYYVMGDYIGISGIEKSYEKALRGKKGVKIFLVDVHNRIKGSYKEGRYDTLSVAGKNVTTTLDFRIQEYAEILMQNKIGSVVAIEPSTGEIIALVSSPSYDPALLVGRARGKNYKLLSNDNLKPLFNRALMAQYPPGSTFKLVNSLIGLEEKVITTQSTFQCNHGYTVGNFSMACHHSGTINFTYSIQGSCNAYYANVFRRILDNPHYGNVSLAFAEWRSKVVSFGLGNKMNSDFSNELEGFIPTVDYYDRYYGKNRWKSLMLVSMAIGQGEVLTTPFQMANLMAVIANRGYYYTPHIIKEVEGEEGISSEFFQKKKARISPEYFEPVIEAMELVVKAGTAVSAFHPKIPICGKTGTAENPHGKDHSIFVAFAPREEPKIAIAVYIENAGFGSTWAAPIASLLIEKYLTDSISRPLVEKRILEKNLIIGKDEKEEKKPH